MDGWCSLSKSSSIPWDLLFLFGLFTAIVGFLLAHWWLTVRMRKYQDRIRVLETDDVSLPLSYPQEYPLEECENQTCPITTQPSTRSEPSTSEPAIGKRSREEFETGASDAERLCHADIDVPDAKKPKPSSESTAPVEPPSKGDASEPRPTPKKVKAKKGKAPVQTPPALEIQEVSSKETDVDVSMPDQPE